MSTKTKTTVCAAFAALVTTAAFAGQTAKVEAKSSVSSKLTGEVSAEFVSGYAFRGQLLDANPALQLSLGASVPFDVSAIGLDGGSVNFKTTQLFSQNVPKAGWYRSEAQVGISLTKGMFTVSPSYQFFNSPTGRFDAAHGFNLLVSAKDPFNINPFVNGFFGVQGNANDGTSTGAYYEFGVAPSFALGKLSVGVPASVGFGTKGYYNNDQSYGFTSVGVTTSYPIYGNVSVNAGVRYLNTNNTLNQGRKDIFTSTVGLGLTF